MTSAGEVPRVVVDPQQRYVSFVWRLLRLCYIRLVRLAQDFHHLFFGTTGLPHGSSVPLEPFS
jgi:hypothetical protein